MGFKNDLLGTAFFKTSDQLFYFQLAEETTNNYDFVILTKNVNVYIKYIRANFLNFKQNTATAEGSAPVTPALVEKIIQLGSNEIGPFAFVTMPQFIMMT